MANNPLALSTDNLKSRIYTIRNMQVMLDTDLAELYDVEARALNQAVKRNIERFPERFMFKLTYPEHKSLITTNQGEILRSQFVTLNTKKEASGADFIPKSDTLEKDRTENLKFQFGTSNHNYSRQQFTTENRQNLKSQFVTSRWGGKRKLPYAFTEQGVAMLSGVLKSKTAIDISIHIIDAFVELRRFVAANADVFHRIGNMEVKLIEHDKKFNEVFDAIQEKGIKPEKGIFFDGQIFDSYKFVSDLIRAADKSIILIDNYIDDSVLTLFSKRNNGVKITIFTKDISKQLSLDLAKYNSQYQQIEIKEFKQSHDRFLIIDNTEVYHLGASLKDLGKKWFAFSKFDKEAFNLLSKLGLK